ncbi:MAG: hypothetical protein N2316_08420, partial [Spirochaetes bacterium]|nr:hypothetical protein [Spirochaetota bacterium]
MRGEKGRLLLLTIFVLIFFWKDEKKSISSEDHYSPDALVGFVQYLYKNQEYYRALVEFDRLNAYWPNYIPLPKASVVRMHLLFKGKQFDDVLKETIGNELTVDCAAAIYRSDVLLHKGLMHSNLDFFVRPKCECDDFFRPFFWKRNFLFAVLADDEKKVHQLLAESFFPKEILDEKQVFISIYQKAKQQRENISNPSVAMLAGFIPGLGYCVGGNTPTGILTFAVVSIFSALTVAAFSTDNKPIGIMLGAATFFFYGGSIIGGYMQTK